MRRKRPINRYNAERRKRRFKKQFGSSARVAWMRALPCICGACRAPSECHHVKSRGAGGGPDDMVPLSPKCHREIHNVGAETFEKKLFLSLTEYAQLYAQQWAERADAQDL